MHLITFVYNIVVFHLFNEESLFISCFAFLMLEPYVMGFGKVIATWGKVLTLDQLQRRGWPLANRCSCSLYYVHEESIDHILLHCGKARLLWELLFSLFRLYWVIHSTVKGTLLGWHGSIIGRKRKRV